jgi:thiol-disulfide isomerase/thioredoxin
MRRAAGLAAGLAACLVTGLLGGCASSAPGDSGSALRSRIVVDSPELRQAKARARVVGCPATAGPGSALPDLTLPCLGGGRPLNLSEVSGPAVISLWASWCTYCPDELPLYQRLRRQAGNRLTVLGVDWQDTNPDAAIALLRRTGAVFPQLADPGGELADHYRVRGLPGMLLVDSAGRVTFRLQRIESYRELAALVADHTGVNLGAG